MSCFTAQCCGSARALVFGSAYFQVCDFKVNMVESNLLNLTCHIRNFVVTICCGNGKQNFRWLGYVCAHLYAEEYDLDCNYYSVSGILSETQRLLLPYECILDHCQDGEHVYVTLHHPSIHATTSVNEAKETIWQLYASFSKEQFIPVVFRIDLDKVNPNVEPAIKRSDAASNESIPAVTGNFVGWNASIPLHPEGAEIESPHISRSSNLTQRLRSRRPSITMSSGLKQEVSLLSSSSTSSSGSSFGPRPTGSSSSVSRKTSKVTEEKSKGVYTLELNMPPGALLFFSFVYKGQELVSADHNVALHSGQNFDECGTRLQTNCFYVPSHLEKFASSTTPSQSSANVLLFDSVHDAQQAKNKIVSQEITDPTYSKCGFLPVKHMDEKVKRVLFEQDMSELQIADVIRGKDSREAIAETLWQHYDLIIDTFKFYCCQGGQDIGFMNAYCWTQFAKKCHFIDKRITLSVISVAFKRVNVEEKIDETLLDESSEAAARTSMKEAFVIESSEDNPDNKFTRSEFMEGIIRIAVDKYRDVKYEEAVERIFETNIVPFAEKLEADTIRQGILNSEVQKVYSKYMSKLHILYLKYIYLDKVQSSQDSRVSISVPEYNSMLQDLDLGYQKLTRRKALMAFASSVTGGSEEMVWPEFLELLARLACFVTDAQEAPLADKLSAFFGKLQWPKRSLASSLSKPKF